MHKFLKPFCLLMMFAACSLASFSQQSDKGIAVGETVMQVWKDSFLLPGDKTPKWRYDQGVVLKGIEGLWNRTGDGRWFQYIQKSMDYFVGEDGSIKGYKPGEFNIDNINNGRLLLTLYRVTGKDKYRKAADLLRDQLRTHPRTSEGGFWHKKIYPNQMWLDGLYMGEPFYAEYAQVFGDDSAFDDVARQFILMERHARDPKSGLLYHGWDEGRTQKWADPATGRSPHVWSRAMGWYGMALVDALDYFPVHHPKRDSLVQILKRFAKAISSVQDKKTGLWYDILDMPGQPGNYFEASGSSMFLYTLAKAVRRGYISARYTSSAEKGYRGIVADFIRDENGQTNLHGTVSVSGLGGNPYRDGSFSYYIGEPVVTNDPKGVGAFIMAANEIAAMHTAFPGSGKTVLLDYYFNNEYRKDYNGKDARWHYTWEDRSNSGFSALGDVAQRFGAKIVSLTTAPDAASLNKVDVYLIVDPDTDKETFRPSYITNEYAETIAAWVKQGGVLILMTNDKGNADLEHSNLLAGKFGIQFNEDNFNLVTKDQFEQGVVNADASNGIFKTAHKLYIKELATLNVQSPAKSVLQKDGRNVAAVAKYGKGSVFIIGDPWLYNEYVDGRKLPAGYENYQAIEDLLRWAFKAGKKK